MATKRPHSAVHPSRTAQVPGEPIAKRARRGKPSHITGPSFKKAHTVHDLKSTIRSLRRLLSHNDDLPATVRVDKERALQSAERELAGTERAKKRSEVIGRWHKVRFFERQKASKRVKRLKKAVKDAEGKEVKSLERELRDAEVDVNYAIYYPLETEYVPLFAAKRREGDVAADADVEEDSPGPAAAFERKGDPEMWERVKQSMADGTLEALRNGKLDGTPDEVAMEPAVDVHGPVAKRKHEKVKKPAPPVEGNRRERRKAAAAAKVESDDDSEGGFFE